MMPLEAVDHPLDVAKLNVYIVDPDQRYAQKLTTILRGLGVPRVETQTDYQTALTYLSRNPERHNLIIVGGTLVNDELLATVEAMSRMGVLAMLVLIPAIDAKGIRKVLKKISVIKDCAEKTQDRRAIKHLIEDMVDLINGKVVKALYPFGHFD